MTDPKLPDAPATTPSPPAAPLTVAALVVMLQKMHAQAHAQFNYYNRKNDTVKAQFWIGGATQLANALQAAGAKVDATEMAKATVDLNALRKVEGQNLVAEKEAKAGTNGAAQANKK